MVDPLSLEVPPSLQDRVRTRDGALSFRCHPISGPSYLVDRMSRLWGPRGITPGTVVTVSKDGVRFGRRGRIAHRGQTVRLVGDPGEPANLFVNGAEHPLLYTHLRPPGSGAWSTRDVLWLGRAVSTLLEVPWRVEWDRDGWDRWNHDPIVRGRAALDAATRRSQERYPDYHRYQPEEPPGVVSLDTATYHLGTGLSRVTVHLGPEGVRSPRWEVRWESIHAIATAFERRPGMRAEGYLRVAYYDEVLDLVQLSGPRPIDAAQLRWLEAELRNRARAPRQAKGTMSEVPAPLRDLRGP